MSKSILLLTSSNPRTRYRSAFKATSKLANDLNKDKGLSVEYERLQQIVFFISNDKVEGELPSGKKLDQFDAIYVKNWLEEPWFGGALRNYLDITENTEKLCNDEFVDFPNVNKFIEVMRFRQHGVPVCDTVFSININRVAPVAKTYFGFPFVLKNAEGRLGRDNYLITSELQLEDVINRHQNELFVAQRYVPNKCDYRILVTNNEPRLIIKRSRTHSNSHLNNVSRGADAELINIADFDREALTIAVQAARCFQLNICGVDLLQNSETNDWYALEANVAPDLTGSFVDEKFKVFSDFLTSAIN